METQLLRKEELGNIKFSTKEVISDKKRKADLMAELLRAQTLGNLEKIKVKITFQLADYSLGKVETTVWALGNEHIILKGGVHIPIKCIESISTL